VPALTAKKSAGNIVPADASGVLRRRIQEKGMHTAIRFRWQSGAIALAAIVVAFLGPGILLCKVVSLANIALAIAIATLVAGFGLYLAGRSIEKRTPRSERVDHCLQASIFVIAAGLLWFHVVFQTGPWRDRSIEFGPALAIASGCGIAGALMLIRRARRLAGSESR
jgi:hypothetical protein